MAEEPDFLYDIQTKWHELDLPKFMILTGAFYFLEETIVHPLEVIRTKLQVDKQPFSLNSARNVIRTTGIRGLYTAFWTCSLGFIPGNFAYIASYQYFKDRFQSHYNKLYPERADGRQAPIVSFGAGFIADAIAVTFYCPIDVIAQRRFLRDSNKVYSSSFDAVKKIAQQEGFKGFFKGFGPLLVNSLPASALWWTLYETSKTWTSKHIHVFMNGESSPGTVVVGHNIGAQFVSGVLAGGVTALATNPLDVVRTRMQTQEVYPKESHEAYRSSIDAIRTILRNEGATAFIKGIGPRVVSWSFISGGSAYLYELSVKLCTIKKD